MTINRVAVVVLNWDGEEIIRGCIDSLLNQTYKDFQIVVVDNGSSDSSRETLENYRSRFNDRVKLIYNDRNLGFAGGVNVGIDYALTNSFDAVALFNNDAIANESWLDKLVSAINSDENIGIATGLLLHDDGKTIDSAGDFYSIWGLAFPRMRDEKSSNAPESGYVFGATGGASLYRLDMLREIGLFDKDFFAYYEDVDLSFRAQLGGWKVFYNKEAVAYHKRGATSDKLKGFGKYQMFKNLPMLFIKNVPKGILLKIWARFKFIYSLMFINSLLSRNFISAIKGVTAGGYLFFRALSKRRVIQGGRRVSAKYIYSIIYKDLPPTQKGRMGKFIKSFSRK